MSDGKYPITGSVWFRESTQEWVLELEGSINGTYFIDRHTEPSTTLPEDVPGLPSLYEKLERGQKVKALKQILEERGAVFDAMVDAAENAAGKDVSFNVVVGRALRAAIAEIKGETK